MEQTYSEVVWSDKRLAVRVYLTVAALSFIAGAVLVDIVPWMREIKAVLRPVFFGAATLLLIGAFADTRPFRIRVRRGRLTFGFWYSRQRIDLSDIEWVAAEDMWVVYHGDATAREAMGAISCFVREGPGVRIRVRREKLDRVIPTGNREALAEALGQPLLPCHPSPPPTFPAIAPTYRMEPLPWHYEYEEAHHPGWKQWGAFAVLVTIAVVELWWRVWEHHAFPVWDLIIAVGILVSIWQHLQMLRMRVGIGAGQLVIVRGHPVARFFLEDIEWAALDRLGGLRDTISPWRESGIRLTFAANAGPGVRLRVRNYHRFVVVRSHDPEALARAPGKELLAQPPGLCRH